jgi:hypothetical protein
VRRTSFILTLIFVNTPYHIIILQRSEQLLWYILKDSSTRVRYCGRLGSSLRRGWNTYECIKKYNIISTFPRATEISDCFSPLRFSTLCTQHNNSLLTPTLDCVLAETFYANDGRSETLTMDRVACSRWGLSHRPSSYRAGVRALGGSSGTVVDVHLRSL